MNTRKWMDDFSNGKHICCRCIHSAEMDDGELRDTTLDWNSCDKMTTGGKDWNYKENIETEDNGGGYWITKCKFFKFDKDWDKVKYHTYIKSDEWKEKRKKTLERDDYQCQRCGTGMNLVVHHITYDRLGKEDLDDLITLCKKCHEEIHGKDIKEEHKNG